MVDKYFCLALLSTGLAVVRRPKVMTKKTRIDRNFWELLTPSSVLEMLFLSRSKLITLRRSLCCIFCVIYFGIFRSSASGISEVTAVEGSSIDLLGNHVEVDTDFEVKLVERRSSDHCKELIRDYGKKHVASCVALGNFSPFCDRATCPGKPSPAAGILPVKKKLNKTTNRVDIEVEWNVPDFGTESLCGFQVSIASLKSEMGSDCKQINSKTRLSYKKHGLLFGGRYNITIVSLPSYKNMDKSSTYVEIDIPDKCEMYMQSNERAPWDCRLPKHITTSSCINGTVNVTLERPQDARFGNYGIMLLAGSRVGPCIKQQQYDQNSKVFLYTYGINHVNATFAVMKDLRVGIPYVVRVFYGTRRSVSSRAFFCQGDLPRVNVSNCTNGTVTASWNRGEFHFTARPHRALFKLVDAKNSKLVRRFLVEGKEVTNVTNLKWDTDYILMVDDISPTQAVLGKFKSAAFSCRGKVSSGSRLPDDVRISNAVMIIIVTLISIVIMVPITIVLVKRRKLLLRVCYKHRREPDEPSSLILTGSSECIPSTRCKKVLFVYPDGCEYIKSFVMLIGQLLHANSCECILDLVNRRQVDTAGGRDQFILDNLDEAGCVIVVYYRDTSEPLQNAFEIHETVIRRLIFSGRLSIISCLPIHFNEEPSIAQITDSFNFGEDAGGKLTPLLMRIMGAQEYQFGAVLPERNELIVSSELRNQINVCSANISKCQHSHCLSRSCRKGTFQPAVEGQSECSFPMSQLPFDSRESIDDAVKNEQIKNFVRYQNNNFYQGQSSRICASEPFLVNAGVDEA